MTGFDTTFNNVLQVLIDGSLVEGLIHAAITSTSAFSADTYALTFGINVNGSPNLAYWSSIASAYIEVYASITGGLGPVFLIGGLIDTIHVDPVRQTVGIEGRDLSSVLIDAYRQEEFVNQTASEIVSTVAFHHNLLPIVTSTQGNVGRYYADGFTKISLGQFSKIQTDWDLLVELARSNNFELFVVGRSLYFQPEVTSAIPLFLSLNQFERVRFERHLNVPSDVTACVQSWNSQDMAVYKSDETNQTDLSNQTSTINSLPYLFLGSNYTSEQVLEMTERYQTEARRLTTVLYADLPWNLELSPRARFLLNGTQSALDGLYRVETVERRYSAISGSVQSIFASRS